MRAIEGILNLEEDDWRVPRNVNAGHGELFLSQLSIFHRLFPSCLCLGKLAICSSALWGFTDTSTFEFGSIDVVLLVWILGYHLYLTSLGQNRLGLSWLKSLFIFLLRCLYTLCNNLRKWLVSMSNLVVLRLTWHIPTPSNCANGPRNSYIHRPPALVTWKKLWDNLFSLSISNI